MERFQLLLFWGGSNYGKGTGTNAAGCKRLGSSPMASRVWFRFCFRKGLQCKNAQWYLLGEVSQGKHRIEKPKHHNRPPQKVLVGEQKLLEVSNDAQTKRVPAGVGSKKLLPGKFLFVPANAAENKTLQKQMSL